MEPFFKWAGGKTRALPHILRHVPPTVDTYYEPFLGGGAVGLALMGTPSAPRQMVLNDISQDVMRAWVTAFFNTSALVAASKKLDARQGEAEYYRVRDEYNDGAIVRGGKGSRGGKSLTLSPVQMAARFLYINRNGFNGLWRVNRHGQVNTPFGKRVVAFDAVKVAKLPSGIPAKGLRLLCGDYADAIKGAGEGDVVYLDPPYSRTFARYSKEGFGQSDHYALVQAACAAARRGARVIVSQGDEADVVALWREARVGRKAFKEHPVEVRHQVGTKRTDVSERVFVI